MEAIRELLDARSHTSENRKCMLAETAGHVVLDDRESLWIR